MAFPHEGGTDQFSFGGWDQNPPYEFASTEFAGPLGPSLDPFVGIGSVNFSVARELDFEAIGMDDTYSVTVDPGALTASIIYDYTPAPAPEPSFLIMTAGIFGLIAWRAYAKRAA